MMPSALYCLNVEPGKVYLLSDLAMWSDFVNPITPFLQVENRRIREIRPDPYRIY